MAKRSPRPPIERPGAAGADQASPADAPRKPRRKPGPAQDQPVPELAATATPSPTTPLPGVAASTKDLAASSSSPGEPAGSANPAAAPPAKPRAVRKFAGASTIPEKPAAPQPRLVRTKSSRPRSAAETTSPPAPADSGASAVRPQAGKSSRTPHPAKAAEAVARPERSARPAPARRPEPAARKPAPAAIEASPEAPIVPAPTPFSGLRILMVASEVVPFAKTGGLADVAGALPSALGRLGHEMVVAMPRYRGIDVSGAPRATFALTVGPASFEVRLFEASIGAHATVWLIDIPALYDRDGLYGDGGQDHPDNPLRFATLARAALEGALVVEFTPDVVHAHDWQGGLAPVYLRTRYATHPVLGGIPSVFTIHNVAYTGRCDPGWLPALDLGWELLSPQAIEYWGQVSFLKAGINFSEQITTVSRRYAEEILTPEFAYGFEGILAARRADLVGILNGVETDTWNPAADPFIPTPYSAASLAGKRDAKRALLTAFGLPADEAALGVPLIGMVSRMVEQKGLGLIAEAAADLPHLGARFVILGSGEPWYEEMWRTLAAAYPDRIAVRIGFDEGLSHLLEAGSDLFLMPSRFEPCGLNQMYSLRYGTLPVVRATGGLDDTVDNYNPETGTGNGFKFWEPSGPALVNTLRWALRVYEHPEVWPRLQRQAMAGDFSWDRSAAQYVRVYEEALARVGRARTRRAPGGA